MGDAGARTGAGLPVIRSSLLLGPAVVSRDGLHLLWRGFCDEGQALLRLSKEMWTGHLRGTFETVYHDVIPQGWP